MSKNTLYNMTDGKEHEFHVLEPSILPIVAAFSVGLLAVGAILFFHHPEFFHIGMKGIFIGFALVLYIMWSWWKRVIKEAVEEKAHSKITKTGFRYGMSLFIVSEIMFFMAFFWAFFNASLNPTEAIGFVWPPKGIEAIDAFELPFLMTLVLLLSGCTVTWAHHAILEDKKMEALEALVYTITLALFFTSMQVYEYTHATFAFKNSIYGTTFYMATGFHGFHVIIGTIFLMVTLFRVQKGHFTAKSHFGFEAAAWYWHFVDVVWLFLFISIYWWGNGQ